MGALRFAAEENGPFLSDDKALATPPWVTLLELWKRIVFNMAVSNTDDHLRNYGFVLTKEGKIVYETGLFGMLLSHRPTPSSDDISYR